MKNQESGSNNKERSSKIDQAINAIAVEISRHFLYAGSDTDLDQKWVDQIVIKHQVSFLSLHNFELPVDNEKIRQKLIRQNLV